MRGAVMHLCRSAQRYVHTGNDVTIQLIRNAVGEVNDEVVFPFGVEDFECAGWSFKPATVTHLASALCIKRCAVKDNLVALLALCLHLAVAKDAGFCFQ